MSFIKTIKVAFILLVLIGLFSCSKIKELRAHTDNFDSTKEEIKITIMLDSFNLAAAKADFNGYFNFYADGAIFTGTDATERWNKEEFMI